MEVAISELVVQADNCRTHRSVFVRALCPGHRRFRVDPHSESHSRYDIRMTRRDFLPALAMPLLAQQGAKPTYRKGKLKQALCNGVFGRGMALEERCQH